MSDQTSAGNFNAAELFHTAKGMLIRGDIALAIGLVMILVVMILPMPSFLLDILLALSMTMSVLILMTVLFIQKPLEFSSFPTILLITTLLRLSLNLASTRLILAHGHEGPDAAGDVIEAFAGFVMGGNFVIGVIVFAILTIVNFVVITKGSGRIAEVAARFTLDAMPGKQMAIDADLSAGLIDEPEARRRRKELEEESAFFGSMDGASKFVRGDAFAGLMITFINVIGGMVIGIAQHDLPFMVAADTYTRLTIGDGLVSQIPALIISVAAGLLVSKAGVSGSADKALFGQLSGYPTALGCRRPCCSRWACCPACRSSPSWRWPGRPGSPPITCRRCASASRRKWPKWRWRTRRRAPIADEPIATALSIDSVRLELGYGLLTLINTADRRLPPDRPDQGSAPPACRRGRLRPAVGPHPGQPAASAQHLCRADQGDRVGPRRYPAQHAAGDGPARRGDLAARRAHGGADLRPARHVDRAELPRGSAVQGPHRGRCLHRHHDAPDRGHQGQHARPALLRRDAEAAGRDRAREPEAGGRRHPRRRSPWAGCSACCRTCWASASRSATCPPSWKAYPRPAASPATSRPSPSMSAPGWPARSPNPTPTRPASFR